MRFVNISYEKTRFTKRFERLSMRFRGVHELLRRIEASKRIEAGEARAKLSMRFVNSHEWLNFHKKELFVAWMRFASSRSASRPQCATRPWSGS
jgi:hypothetical protein